MGLHLYLTEHLGTPGVAESVFYGTTSSPAPLEPAVLGQHTKAVIPEPTTRFWHKELLYPEVSRDPVEAVAEVEARYANCAGCHLSNRRTRVSFIKGNPLAACAFFGEGPGRTEDAQGVPFVGESGRLEDKLCLEQGIDPLTDLCWFNLVGCRPCDTRWAPNRPPSCVERFACSERTLMLLRAIRPRVVVCLGAEPTSLFWDKPPDPWTWHTLYPPSLNGDWMAVGYARHPAYLLRTLPVQGGARELHASRRFLGELKKRLAGLDKLPLWPLPLQYLSEAGRVVTEM